MKPVGGPVERAEKRAGRDRRIGARQVAGPDAGCDERADAALVLVAFRHDCGAKLPAERVYLEMSGGALDVADEALHVGDRKIVQPG